MIGFAVILMLFLNGNNPGERNAIDATPEPTAPCTPIQLSELEDEEPALPQEVTLVQIWLGSDFLIRDEFTLNRGEVLRLTGVIEPPGLDVELHWEDADNDGVFTWEHTDEGIVISHAGEGLARLTLTAGGQSETLIVRGR